MRVGGCHNGHRKPKGRVILSMSGTNLQLRNVYYVCIEKECTFTLTESETRIENKHIDWNTYTLLLKRKKYSDEQNRNKFDRLVVNQTIYHTMSHSQGGGC